MANPVLKQNLTDARQLISDFDCWLQGEHAQDNLGSFCNPLDDEAVCWCADGAILKVTETDSEHSSAEEAPQWYDCSIALRDAAHRLYPSLNCEAYPHVSVNDGEVADLGDSPEKAHAAILAVFDDAIAHA